MGKQKTKRCSNCGKQKSIKEFHKNRRKADGLQTHCKICHIATGKKNYPRYYAENKDAFLLRRERFKNLRRELIRKEKAKPCKDCGNDYPYYVMQFDHVRGKKVDDVSRMARSVTLAVLRKEIAKCEVVCANCHAQRTHDRRIENKIEFEI